MHPRLRARQSATVAFRIEQLEAAKRIAVERLELLQRLLASLPDQPALDRVVIERALSTARRMIDEADPTHVERWTAMLPLLTSTNVLVESVVKLLAHHYPPVAATP